MAVAFADQLPIRREEMVLSIDPEIVAAMNRWRLEQAPVQNCNEAIISLIRLGLASQKLASPDTHAPDYEVEQLARQFRVFLAKNENPR
ncbi:hypothetical protein [Devosia beringensis]|uniref:hypothetical protein n=1 Tax=Devosia beringensis TaxID=2657486 RepID=UPI00186BA5CB|nr:hypothetical protein [Devosia beringensis]